MSETKQVHVRSTVMGLTSATLDVRAADHVHVVAKDGGNTVAVVLPIDEAEHLIREVRAAIDQATARIPNVLWCNGCEANTRPADEWHDGPRCSRCGDNYTCPYCGYDVDRFGHCQRKWPTKSVRSFHVGDRVWVYADQGFRHGTVTELGRTRIKVAHPRNKQGVMVERPYTMHAIVLGQTGHHHRPDHGWVSAAGEWRLLTKRVPDVPDL